MEKPETVVKHDSDDAHKSNDEYQQLIQSLPKEVNCVTGATYCLYQGFWILEFVIRGVFAFQKHFQALDDDLVLASCPKSGTTWLKALSFSIINRYTIPLSDSPLLTSNPHSVVPTLEFDVYDKHQSIVDINNIPKPRLLSTHVSFESLPISIKKSKCKIVYIWRNPMDQAVSLWHFLSHHAPKDVDTNDHRLEEEFFGSFCRGAHLFGPFWDHVLGFWKASLESPDKILFIKYEDLKRDTLFQVKQLAEFLGFPFSEEEEKQGVIEQISTFCSIENMKSLKGNSNGTRLSGATNSSYFRKGQVGDWVNHLSTSMAERMEKLIQDKFKDSGLKF